jgi:membrane protein DedA with SNARE-associated domain
MTCLTTIVNDPRKRINLFHVAAVAPFLGYLGYMGVQGISIDQRLHYVLLAVAVLVFAYHGYRLVQDEEKSDE